MNDPNNRNYQELTDLLLQLDRVIAAAEANVAMAQQLRLPEASSLAVQLPALTYNARAFLASIPDMGQSPRWGEMRRLIDQARSFRPRFEPYIALGHRITRMKQLAAEQEARAQAIAAANQRARDEQQTYKSLEETRYRFSQVRQMLADMHVQRGPGFDDTEWLESIRSVNSMLTAQDVRIASAVASIRDGAFDQAQAQLDQTLGELQAALDTGQRARAAAQVRAQPYLNTNQAHSPLQRASAEDLKPQESPRIAELPRREEEFTKPAGTGILPTLSLIEVRTGTIFRCDARSIILGRGHDAPLTESTVYLDLSHACDPGEAEYLGVSRRHAAIQSHATGFVLCDLGSTNGTGIYRADQNIWETLVPQKGILLKEGDKIRFGLLECTVALSS